MAKLVYSTFDYTVEVEVCLAHASYEEYLMNLAVSRLERVDDLFELESRSFLPSFA